MQLRAYRCHRDQSPAHAGPCGKLSPIDGDTVCRRRTAARWYSPGRRLDFDFVATEKLPAGAKVLSAARSAGGRVWVVTDRGAFRSSGDSYRPLEVGPRQLEPGQPRSSQAPAWWRSPRTASDRSGSRPTAGSISPTVSEWWQSLDRRDGVPYEAMTCLHLAPNGDVWGGTSEGAWRLRDGQFRYFWGLRWLPGNRVRAIWTDAKGADLARDRQGHSPASRKSPPRSPRRPPTSIGSPRNGTTAAASSVRFDFASPGDPSKGYRFDVSDNDGLWTAMYVGAMALRYGATKDPAAHEHARDSLNALLDLERRTGLPGFPARAMVDG